MHRGCLVTVCVKSLNAFSTCCSDKLKHFFPSKVGAWYFLHYNCSKALQTCIPAHLKLRLSCIHAGVTIVEVYLLCRKWMTKHTYYSSQIGVTHTSNLWMNVLIHSEWWEGCSTLPPLLIKPVSCLHSQLSLAHSPSPRLSFWWLDGLKAWTPYCCIRGQQVPPPIQPVLLYVKYEVYNSKKKKVG